MSRLERLIQELCPEGVEYLPLGSICDIFIGSFVKKTGQDSSYEYPVYNGGIEPTGYFSTYNCNKNSVVISARGANCGFVNFVSSNFWAGNSCYVLKRLPAIVEVEFLFYFLKCSQNKLFNLRQTSGIPAINSAPLSKFLVPVPPLPVQQEIVRILDKFSALEAELEADLEAELEARKHQYAYYLNSLLSLENAPKMLVGDLFEFKNGLNKGKEFFGKGSPIVNYVDVYKNRALTESMLKGKVEVSSKEKVLYSAQKNDVFFTRTSETKEEIGMVTVLLDDIEDCVFSGFVLRARPITNLLLPKFCAYCFSSYHLRKEIVRNSSYTTRALTNGTVLSKLYIPVPPLPEQARIVAILDRFDALTNDITSGLPAEIVARRKQYEYYRDKLLTFKEKVS